MSDCNICKKRIKIFDEITLRTFNLSIYVCKECSEQMKALKKGDYSAYKYIHSYISDPKTSPVVRSFVSSWETLPQEVLDEQKAEKERQNLAKLQRENEKKKILLSTTPMLIGYDITAYLGIASGEVVLGTGFLSELSAGINDLFGSTSESFKNKLDTAKNAAIDMLLEKALNQNANAVIGIDFDYITFSNNMIGVVANGTLVNVSPSETN